MKSDAETILVDTNQYVVFELDEQRHALPLSAVERIIRAVSNPHTTVLGHMTGRQLLRRPGYEVDIEEILAACAEHGVAVEINANPWRLDLDCLSTRGQKGFLQLT